VGVITANLFIANSTLLITDELLVEIVKANINSLDAKGPTLEPATVDNSILISVETNGVYGVGQVSETLANIK
jgi:N-acetylglucosamine-6-phosphate deacetylase